MARTEKRTMTVRLVQSSEVLNTRIIAELVASKIKRGETHI